MTEKVHKSAALSDDGFYRYNLVRRWDLSRPMAVFVMLNPSVADASIDDPTIRRCIGFGKRWGRGGIVVVNLYALRTPNPVFLWKSADPVGARNDQYIRGALWKGSPVVVAWGVNARQDRVKEFLELAADRKLYCLGTTKTGAPRHPLYVRGTHAPEPWRGL
jgi:hypothetical protein